MTLEFVPGATSITFGGVDIITPTIDTSKPIAMRFERVTEENFLDGWAKPIRVILRGRTGFSPMGYRLLFGRSHPRIRRMHSAYSRKRGRGRW